MELSRIPENARHLPGAAKLYADVLWEGPPDDLLHLPDELTRLYADTPALAAAGE